MKGFLANNFNATMNIEFENGENIEEKGENAPFTHHVLKRYCLIEPGV